MAKIAHFVLIVLNLRQLQMTLFGAYVVQRAGNQIPETQNPTLARGVLELRTANFGAKCFEVSGLFHFAGAVLLFGTNKTWTTLS